jgi:hypothetical protein
MSESCAIYQAAESRASPQLTWWYQFMKQLIWPTNLAIVKYGI